MKLFVHYEESDNVSAHKTLKMTLPKSWRSGPTSKILHQFIESYNECLPPLDASLFHLAVFRTSPTSPAQERTSTEEGIFDPVPCDAAACQALSDRDHVYVRSGPSQTMSELGKSYSDDAAPSSSFPSPILDPNPVEPLLRCTNFGCKVQFPKGCAHPPSPCVHHAGPPVFHETAKFWSCCPNKRAYDWDEFESIPGCVVDEAGCTHLPKTNARSFLGGCDLRAEAVEKSNQASKLRSIDDFNRMQGGNSSEKSVGNNELSILTRLRDLLLEMGIEHELFDQVVEGIKHQIIAGMGEDVNSSLVNKAVVEELGAKWKRTLKSMAVDQLRIK